MSKKKETILVLSDRKYYNRKTKIGAIITNSPIEGFDIIRIERNKSIHQMIKNLKDFEEAKTFALDFVKNAK